MKKMTMVVMMAVMTAAFAATAHAQAGGPARPDPRGGKPPAPIQMLMEMLRQKSTAMETLPDGSVILLRAGKLSKYDKDLNLVKEVEVPAELKAEAGMPCPMCGQMVPESGAGN